MAEYVVIQLDTNDLQRVLNSMHRDIENTAERVLQQRLSYRSNQIAKQLNDEAPEGRDTARDTRFNEKLKGSFYVERQGQTRIVKTRAPEKYAWVTLGTVPHWIFPRNKKALWWPGAEHPVFQVFHPGSSPNPFAERVLNNLDLHEDAQSIADLIAIGITTQRYQVGSGTI